MLGKLKDLTINVDQSQNVTVTINEDFRETFDKLKDGDVNIEIKKASKHRSMDANNYLWHLCGEIAKESSKYSNDGKNEVYREAIQAKGEFEPLIIREDAVETFIKRWGQKGTGWFAEIIDDYNGPLEDVMNDYAESFGFRVQKYKIIHAYYGSSTYSSAAMSRIINYVVNIANDLGIPTMTPFETDRILTAWNKKTEK